MSTQHGSWSRTVALAGFVALSSIAFSGCEGDKKEYYGSTLKQLEFVGGAPPAATAGQPLLAAGSATPVIRVQISNEVGVLLPTATDAVTITLASNGTGATLSGTLTQNAVNGVATFDDLSVDRAGSYSFLATAGGALPATSASFSVSAATASTLSFGRQPSNGFTSMPLDVVEVDALDAFGNPATGGASQVTLTLSGGPGALSGTTTTTVTNGAATFSDLRISQPGTYQLTASASGVPSITSTPFSVGIINTPLVGALRFATQPTASAEGATLAPALQVELINGSGAVITTATTTVQLSLGANPSSGTLSGTLSATPVNGVATFSNLRLDNAGSSYTLVASAGGFASATTNTFDVIAAAARQLAFGVSPGGANSEGGVIAPAVTVEVRTSANLLVSTANGQQVTLSLGNNPGGATLSGTLTRTVVNGVATFNDLVLDRAGTNYTLTATASALGTAHSNQFSIAAATARQLAFQVQPQNGSEGALLTSFQVAIRNGAGGLVSATNPVTLQLGANPAGAALQGTLTVAAVNGIATFSDVRVDTPGTGLTLVATSSGLTQTQSAAFNVAAAQAKGLSISLQPPATVTEGVGFGLDVQVLDALGAPLTQAGVPVIAVLASNPNGGTLRGTTTVSTNGSGVAQFSGLTVTGAAGSGYQLLVSSPTTTGALSNGFSVTPSVAASLTHFSGPGAPTEGAAFVYEVQVRDSGGTPLMTAGIPVTLSLASNPGGGTLGGALTQSTAANGVATFSVTLDEPGTGYQLLATSIGAGDLVGPSFTVGASTARALTVTSQPTPDPVAAGAAVAFAVRLQDALGSPATLAGVPVTVSLGSNPGGSILGGSLTVDTDASGTATFSDLRLDRAGSGYRLVATSPGLVGTSSAAAGFTVTGGTLATKLVVVSGPTPGAPTEGQAFSFAVQVQDSANAPITGTAIPVTLVLASNPGGSILEGVLTQSTNPATGTATFSGLSLDRAGTGYQLLASSAGTSDVLTAAFDLSPSSVDGLTVTTPVGTVTENQAFAVSAQLLDSQGAALSLAGVSVTVHLASNPGGGALSGTRTATTNGSGVASFSDLVISGASGAGYQLLATTTATPSTALTSAFGVTPKQAAALALFGGAPGVTPNPVVEGQAFTFNVQARDSAGAALNEAGIPVTLALANNPGSATLSGAVTRLTDVNGVAAFSVVIDEPGTGYQLLATSPGTTSFVSAAFDVSATSARALTIATQPNTVPVAAGSPFGLQVRLQDALGGNAALNDVPVTVALASNPGGATLSGTLTVLTDPSGLATFSGLSLDRAGTGYRLVASSPGLTNALTDAAGFEVTGATVAAKLAVLSVPSPTTAEDQPFSVTVQVQDASNVPVTGVGVPVTLVLASNPGGATLTGNLTQTTNPATGTANFSGLLVSRPGAAYQLLASSAGLPDALSTTFDVTATQARALSVTAQASATPTPGPVVEGQTFGLSVQLLDGQGANLTQPNVPVTILLASAPNGGALAGTLTVNTNASGVAVFSDLVLDGAAGAGYQLLASSPATTTALTNVFNVTASQVASLALDAPVSPASPTDGVAFSLSTRLVDASGSFLGRAGVPVTLHLANTPASGGSLHGTLTATTGATGIATFAPVVVGTGAGFQLLATASGAQDLLIGPFTVDAGTARAVQVTSVPAGPVAANAPFTVEATVVDAGGAPVLTSGIPVSLALATNPGGGSLAGALTVNTNASGVAVFNSVSISHAGNGYRFLASAAGLTTGLSSAPGLNVTGSLATSLSYVTSPNPTPTAGQQFTLQLQARDSASAPVGGVSVTLQLASNPGGAVLSGTLTRTTDAGGMATFTDLRLDRAATGYLLLASSPGIVDLLVPTSGTIDVSGSLAATLAVTTQPPASRPENGSFDVAVTVRDLAGNPVTAGGIPVTLSLASNPGGAVLRGDLTVATAAGTGVATFTGLTLDKLGADYQLLASSAGLPDVLTTPLAITASGATSLTVVGQPPATATEGLPFPVVVEVRDGSNAPVGAGVDVTLSLASNAGGGVLVGDLTVPTNGAGQASFSVLVDRAGADYQLVASARALPSTLTSSFTVQASTARALAFQAAAQPPTSVAEGATFGVAVELRDSTGILATTSGVPVTLALSSNPGGGALKGSLTVNTVNGVATFSNLSIDRAGAPFQLLASAASLQDGLSNTFTVTPGLPRQLVFTGQPNNTFALSVINQPAGVQVQIQDSAGNAVLGQSILVTMTFGQNPNLGTLSGTLTRFTDPLTGRASFDDLTIDRPGLNYRLAAVAGNLSSAQSDTFQILGTPVPVGDHLAVTGQPNTTDEGSVIMTGAFSSGAPVTVEVQDIVNGVVGAATNIVTVQLGSNPTGGVLSGTLSVQAVNGVATFNDLTLDAASTAVAGQYTLTFSSSGLIGATSNGFDIDPSLADHLTFVAQPVTRGENQTLSDGTGEIRVQVLDSGTADVNQAGIPVTLSLASNPVSGVLGGTLTRVTDAFGVATFDDLTLDQASSAVVGQYSLRADSSSLTGITSVGFDITPTTAVSLRFRAGNQPTNTDENATVNSAPAGGVVVELVNVDGNVQALDNVPITLHLGNNPASGVLSGTLTVNTVAGLATFPDLSIDTAGAAYQLTATSGGLSPATSTSFDVLPANANRLLFLVQPVSTQSLSNTIGSALPGGTFVFGAGAVSTNLPIDPGTLEILVVDATGTAQRIRDDGQNNLLPHPIVLPAGGMIDYDTGDLTGTAVNLFPGSNVSERHGYRGAATAAESQSIAPAVQVEVVDGGGRRIVGFTGPITLQLGANPGGSTLAGSLTVNATAGVATFSDLVLDRAANGYSLTANTPALTGITSRTFDVQPSVARDLAFVDAVVLNTAELATLQTGTGDLVVELRDSGGGIVLQSGVPVTIALSTNPGNATLRGTTTVLTDAAGLATFSDLTIDTAAAGYVLTATSGALTPASTSSTPGFEILASTARDLAFAAAVVLDTTEGSTLQTGTGDLVVELRDSSGGIVLQSGVPVTIALSTNPGPGTLGGTTTVLTDAAGLATFSDLTIDTAAAGYVLTATSGALTPASTSSTPGFEILASTARDLAFAATVVLDTTEGSTLQTGAGDLVVELRDSGGGIVLQSGVPVTIALSTNPGNATLRGTTTVLTDAAGLATFSDLTVDTAAAGYVLTATSGALTPASTNSSPGFTISPSTARSLAFAAATVLDTTEGSTLQTGTGDLVVELRDSSGGIVLQSGVPVTIALSTNPGTGTLGGTTTVLTDAAGLATFSDLTVDTAAAGYVLTATSGALTPASTSSTPGFEILASTARDLAFAAAVVLDTTEGSTLQTGAGDLVVELRDSGGGIVLQSGVPVTIALSTNPGPGTLGGTTTVLTDAAGLATFSDLTVDTAAAGYVLTATSGALTPASTNSSPGFTISPSTARSLAFAAATVLDTTEGSTLQTGTGDLVVELRDSGGGIVLQSGVPVTIALSTNPGPGTLGGTTTVLTDAAGLATFSDLTVDTAAAGYVLTATSGALTPASTSGTPGFTISPSTARSLAFAAATVLDTTEGSTLQTGAGDLVVELRDSGGGIVLQSGVPVTIALSTNPGNATLRGTTTVLTDAAGLATFSDLTVDTAAAGYVLTATSGALTPASTNSSPGFTISPSTARSLAFAAATVLDTTEGSTLQTGTGDLVVELRDSSGGIVLQSGVPVTIALSTNPGTGTLGGTTTVLTDAAGLATFSDLTVDTAAAGYVLTATSGALTPASTSSTPGFEILASTARDLAFAAAVVLDTTEGSTLQTGAGDLVVELRDSGGGIVLQSGVPVTIALSTNPGPGTLGGTTTVLTDAAGLATFSDLTVDTAAAGYVLTATSGALTPASTNSSPGFTISPSTARSLAFAAATVLDTTEGSTLQTGTGDLVVELRDSGGGIVLQSGVPVTIALSTNPGPGTLGGTTTVLTDAAGLATFSDLTVDTAAAGYVLTATSGALTPASTSGTPGFTISPSTARSLAFAAAVVLDTTEGSTLQTGTGDLVVELRDSGGGIVLQSGVPVTIALSTNPGPGTLGGTTTVLTDAAGLATFSDLTVDTAAAGYVLTATSGALTPASTNSSPGFTISPSTARSLAFAAATVLDTTEGSTLQTGTGDLVVELRDSSGGIVLQSGVPVTIALSTNPGTGTLGGTTTVLTDAAGLATFSDLTVDTAAAGYVLTATSGALTPASTSGTPGFEILASTARDLAFAAATVLDTTEGSTLQTGTGDLVVELRDSGGGIVLQSGVPVTIALSTNPGPGTLGGTTTVLTDAAGLATFSDLTVDTAAAGYVLTATSGALTPASTSSTPGFEITPASARAVAWVVSPATTPRNVVITDTGGGGGASLQVEIQNSVGALVTTATDQVHVFLSVNPTGAVLSGTTSVPAAGGIATFNNLQLDKAGTGYRLVVYAGALAPAETAPFDVTGLPATRLAFGSHPGAASVTEGFTPAAGPIDLGGLSNVLISTTPIHPGTFELELVVGGAARIVTDDGQGNLVCSDPSVLTTPSTILYATGALSGTTVAVDSVVSEVRYQSERSSGPNTIAGPVSPAAAVNLNGASVTADLPIVPGSLTITYTESGGGPVTITDDGFGNLMGTVSAGATVDYRTGTLTGTTNTVEDGASVTETHRPYDAAAGQALNTPAVVVRLLDADGNLDTSANGQVTIDLSAHASNALLGGVRTVNAVNGLATFSGLTVDRAAIGLELSATSPGLTGATSTTFDVNGSTGAMLSLVNQPVNVNEGASITDGTDPLSVQLQDSGGSPVALSGVPVTVAIDVNPAGGALSGTLTRLTDATGVATFPGLSIDAYGTGYGLRFSATGYQSVATNAFNVLSTSPVTLTFSQEPSNANTDATIAPAIVVNVTNGSGANLQNVEVTLVLQNNPGGGVLYGQTTATTDASGNATFNNVAVSAPGTSYRLWAIVSNLAPHSSGTFTISGDPPARLAFTAQPSGADVGAALGSVTVQVQDLSAFPIALATDPITIVLSSNSTGAALLGTLTQGANGTTGTATFADLAVNAPGTYTLTAFAGGLRSATSVSFDVGFGFVASSVATTANVFRIAADDRDLDGDVDLMTANLGPNYFSPTAILDGSFDDLRNGGAGAFPGAGSLAGRYLNLNNVEFVTLGTLVAPGDAIFGSAHPSDTSLRILDAANTTQLNITPTGASSIRTPTIGGFTADVSPDLLVACGNGTNVNVIEFPGAYAPGIESFHDMNFSVAGVAAGVLDGNTTEDIVAWPTATAETNVSVKLQAALLGTFGGANFYDTGAAQILWAVLADADGDGDLDIVTAHAGAVREIRVILNNGSGAFGAPVVTPLGATPFYFDAGDLNGDLVADLAIPLDNNTVEIWLGTVTGTFNRSAVLPTGGRPNHAVIADLDGIGGNDVAVTSPLSSRVDLFLR